MGRPPTPEALADLVARYEAIGGLSPLAELTERQQQRLQQELTQSTPVAIAERPQTRRPKN